MKKLNLIILVLTVLISLDSFAQKTEEKIYSEIGNLTPAEAKFLSKIANQKEMSIEFTNKVKRYYKIEGSEKINLLNELIFKVEDGFINGTFIYYYLTFTGEEHTMTINYGYSAGRALSGEGTVNKVGDSILQTEISWGTGAKTVTSFYNNKKIFEKTIPFNSLN